MDYRLFNVDDLAACHEWFGYIYQLDGDRQLITAMEGPEE